MISMAKEKKSIELGEPIIFCPTRGKKLIAMNQREERRPFPTNAKKDDFTADLLKIGQKKPR